MKLQKLSSKIFLGLFFLLVSVNVFAETKWDVATIFLGQNESSEFQADVETNLAEIARIKPSTFLSVKTYREGPNKSVNREKLITFLKSSFKDTKAKKALIVYGHGEGPLGLRDLPIHELKKILTLSKTKFDLIWFDACFLGNLEFLYELRDYADYTIASQEAEFSAGLPFEALSELPQQDSGFSASTFLAKRFIESYSYLKEGDQRNYVSVSSATISVIDNKELSSFALSFKNVKNIIEKLTSKNREELKNRLLKKFSMDNKELIDLGHLLIELRKMTADKADDQYLTKIIRLLNIESIKKLKSNPRIRINAPALKAEMIFGFNGWENGDQEEYNDNILFQSILKANEFKQGPKNKNWPAKKFDNPSTVLTPFAPGITSFDYYFQDQKTGKILSEKKSITRTHDIIEDSLTNKSDGSFLIYTAYTQQIGTKAERYTGLNIALFSNTPSLDYFELEFNQLTNWLKL